MISITKNISPVLFLILATGVIGWMHCSQYEIVVPDAQIVYVPHTEPVDTFSQPQHIAGDAYPDKGFPLDEYAEYEVIKPVTYSKRVSSRGFKAIAFDTTYVTEWEEVKVVYPFAFITVPTSTSGITVNGIVHRYPDSMVIYDEYGARYTINPKDTTLASPVFDTRKYKLK